MKKQLILGTLSLCMVMGAIVSAPITAFAKPVLEFVQEDGTEVWSDDGLPTPEEEAALQAQLDAQNAANNAALDDPSNKVVQAIQNETGVSEEEARRRFEEADARRNALIAAGQNDQRASSDPSTPSASSVPSTSSETSVQDTQQVQEKKTETKSKVSTKNELKEDLKEAENVEKNEDTEEISAAKTANTKVLEVNEETTDEEIEETLKSDNPIVCFFQGLLNHVDKLVSTFFGWFK